MANAVLPIEVGRPVSVIPGTFVAEWGEKKSLDNVAICKIAQLS
jgi:hypothetical protein